MPRAQPILHAITRLKRRSFLVAVVLTVIAGAITLTLLLLRTPPAVEIGDVVFTTPPSMDDRTGEQLINWVDARELDITFNIDDRRVVKEALYSIFGSNPHDMAFGGVTRNEWFPRWERYEAALIARANENGLPASGLRTCFDKIRPAPTHQPVLLPVAAYRVTYLTEDAWIILCKWEYGDEMGPDGMTHLRMWMMRERDGKHLAFWTCG